MNLNKTSHNIEQEIDKDGDSAILFIMRFKYVDELVTSRFLSLDMSDTNFPINTSVELAYYYAFYGKDLKTKGKFCNVAIENKRLQEIDQILAN